MTPRNNTIRTIIFRIAWDYNKTTLPDAPERMVCYNFHTTYGYLSPPPAKSSNQAHEVEQLQQCGRQCGYIS